MEKALTININGSIFHINEDAYIKLKTYLEKLSRHFGTNPDEKEIMQDIESRISELFLQKIKDENKDIITVVWVNEIISIMGKPEDFEDGENEDKNQKPSSDKKIKHKMYRNPEDRLLGGVCSGTGAYLNISTLAIRLLVFLLFVLTGGFIVILYIFFWIVLPKAKTTAQRIEMRGKEPTVSNIENSIHEEVKDIKDNYKNFQKSDSYKNGKEKISRFGTILISFLKAIIKITIVLAGLFFMFIGISGILVLLLVLLFGAQLITFLPFWGVSGPDLNLPEITNFFTNPGIAIAISIAILFFLIIPLIGIIFAGTKIIFHYRSNNRLIIISGLTIWIIAIIIIISIGFSQTSNFIKGKTATNITTTSNSSSSINYDNDLTSFNDSLNNSKYSTLYIHLTPDSNSKYKGKHFNKTRIRTKNGQMIWIAEPKFDIEKNSKNKLALTIQKSCRGKGNKAKKNLEQIKYNYSLKDSILFLDPYFSIKEGTGWNDQVLKITLKIPEGKSVFLSMDISNIIYDIKNTSNTWDGDMVGRYWKMTADGLSEIKN